MKMNFAKKATALAMSVLFAVSMAGCGSSASTAKKVEVTSVEDLADLKIGVQTGTTGDSQASDAVNADSQMQRYNKGADAIQALKNGKIDCVVIDSLPAEKFVAANDDLKIVEGIFDTEEYAMCFKKGNELRDEFNTALAELKEDGTLDERQEKVLLDLGGWIHDHKEAVFGTEKGLDYNHFLGGSTISADQKTMYLFVYDKPQETLCVKGIKTPVKRVTVLHTGEELRFSYTG